MCTRDHPFRYLNPRDTMTNSKAVKRDFIGSVGYTVDHHDQHRDICVIIARRSPYIRLILPLIDLLFPLVDRFGHVSLCLSVCLSAYLAVTDSALLGLRQVIRGSVGSTDNERATSGHSFRPEI